MFKKKDDKSDWITGGGLLMGMGIGFFLLPTHGGLAFTGCMFTGLGLGLIISNFVPKK